MSVHDFEQAAAQLLPGDLWDFIAGGSGDERTLAANREAWQRIAVLPRVLTGTKSADTRGHLLGTTALLPVATAPVAYQRLAHPDGELATARAAAEAGVPYVLSMLSSHRLEDVAAIGAPTWFQLYWLRDRDIMLDLVRRAEQAGCLGLMVTVDVPLMGRRLRDVRNEFTLPSWISAANLEGGNDHEAHHKTKGASGVAEHTRAAFEPALSWRHLDWLRERTDLPIALKGILDPRDAAKAAERAVNTIVVSNHGGRQLNGAPPTASILPEVVAAVSDQCEIIVDSGIRDGIDVLRAIAAGADGVLLGRPLLWGLAYDGENGAREVLSLLRDELTEALTLAGCPTLPAARRLRTDRESAGAWYR